VSVAFKISMPHRKLLKEVITSLCISSMAAFHLDPKSLISGSTSCTVGCFSPAELGSSAAVKKKRREKSTAHVRELMFTASCTGQGMKKIIITFTEIAQHYALYIVLV
jgi:hypothetical protein